MAKRALKGKTHAKPSWQIVKKDKDLLQEMELHSARVDDDVEFLMNKKMFSEAVSLLSDAVSEYQQQRDAITNKKSKAKEHIEVTLSQWGARLTKAREQEISISASSTETDSAGLTPLGSPVVTPPKSPTSISEQSSGVLIANPGELAKRLGDVLELNKEELMNGEVNTLSFAYSVNDKPSIISINLSELIKNSNVMLKKLRSVFQSEGVTTVMLDLHRSPKTLSKIKDYSAPAHVISTKEIEQLINEINKSGPVIFKADEIAATTALGQTPTKQPVSILSKDNQETGNEKPRVTFVGLPEKDDKLSPYTSLPTNPIGSARPTPAGRKRQVPKEGDNLGSSPGVPPVPNPYQTTIVALSSYIEQREKQGNYKSVRGGLTGTDKTTKLDAAKELKTYLLGDRKGKLDLNSTQYNALIEPFSNLKGVAAQTLDDLQQAGKFTPPVSKLKAKLTEIKQAIGGRLEQLIKSDNKGPKG